MNLFVQVIFFHIILLRSFSIKITHTKQTFSQHKNKVWNICWLLIKFSPAHSLLPFIHTHTHTPFSPALMINDWKFIPFFPNLQLSRNMNFHVALTRFSISHNSLATCGRLKSVIYLTFFCAAWIERAKINNGEWGRDAVEGSIDWLLNIHKGSVIWIDSLVTNEWASSRVPKKGQQWGI